MLGVVSGKTEVHEMLSGVMLIIVTMFAGVLDARAALPDTAVVVLCPQEDAFTPPGAGMRGVAFATPDTLAQVVQAQLTVQE